MVFTVAELIRREEVVVNPPKDHQENLKEQQQNLVKLVVRRLSLRNLGGEFVKPMRLMVKGIFLMLILSRVRLGMLAFATLKPSELMLPFFFFFYRRQAGSKSAAEMRAIAAEARLQKEKSLVKSEAGPSSPKKSFGNFIDLCSSDEEEEDEDDEEEEDIKFTAEEKDWMRKDNDTWKNGGIAKGNGDFDSDSEEED